MKSYIFLVALGLLVCTAHAQTPTDMPSPNSAATDAPSLPIDTMRHRQPTQSAVDQLTRNSASGKCERPNGRDDRLMKSSACTKSLPDHPLPGAINRGFFGLGGQRRSTTCRRIAEAMGHGQGAGRSLATD